MLDELESALEQYRQAWKALGESRRDVSFFASLKPMAVAWKTTDLADFDRRFAELRDASDQIHLGWLDGRWLATFRLKDRTLPWNIRIVKLMQRRPGSTDAAGLDHVDFLAPYNADLRAILKAEPSLRATEEAGDYAAWWSVWFNDTEAKLRMPGKTTLDACIAELEEVRTEMIGDQGD